MRVLFALIAVHLAFGQAPDAPEVSRVRSVRSQASATVTARPDLVRIDIGVITQAQTAQAAAAANAKRFSDVVAELKNLVGAAGNIQTVNYFVSPSYRYPKEGGTPVITGFTANNVVRITSSDVAGSGKVIDAATRMGANEVRSIEFAIKDEQSLRAKALAEAARLARANAEAMAAGIGLKISRVLRMEDSSPIEVRPVRDMMMMARAKAEAVPTPVESGNITVQATVALTAELTQ